MESNKEDIIFDYQVNKMSYRQLVKKYGTNITAISKFLNRHNINIRGNSDGKLGFNILDYKEDIIRMYNIEKIAAVTIAEKYGVGCGTITSYLKKWNVPMRNLAERVSGFCLDDFKEEVLDMYLNEKMTKKAIAEHFNLNPITIRRRLTLWGYEN